MSQADPDGYRAGLEAALRILAEEQAKWEEKAERTQARSRPRSRHTLSAQRVRAAAYKTAGQRVRTALNKHNKAHPAERVSEALPAQLRGALTKLGM